MVEILVDPLFKILYFSEIQYEAIFVGLVAGKGECDRPVVPMYERAVAIVVVLAMGERDVAIGFFASEHGGRKSN